MSIPFVRATQRVCKYCKGTGHNQNNCQHMNDKILLLTQQINEIVVSGNNEDEKMSSLFRYTTYQEICLWMNSIRGLKDYVRLLVTSGSITEVQSKMRYKRDRIYVLKLLYWYSSTAYKNKQGSQKKLNIVAKTFDQITDLSEFECPICVDYKPAKEKTVSNCNHVVCKSCMDSYLNHQLCNFNFPKPKCSLCRTDITTITFANTEYIEELTNKYFTPIIIV